MKHRLAAIAAVMAGMLTVSGTAVAFDCIRVSASSTGMQQSANQSGKWFYVDMSASGGGVAEVLDFFNQFYFHFTQPPTTSQLACIQAAYNTSGEPMQFTLGTGVAGGDTNGPGVLAHNNPTGALSNGTGIDHLDQTVLPALKTEAANCGVT